MENDGNKKLYKHSEKLTNSMNKNHIPYSEHKNKDAHTLEIKYPKSDVADNKLSKCAERK